MGCGASASQLEGVAASTRSDEDLVTEQGRSWYLPLKGSQASSDSTGYVTAEPNSLKLSIRKLQRRFKMRNTDLSSRYDTITGHPEYHPPYSLIVRVRHWQEHHAPIETLRDPVADPLPSEESIKTYTDSEVLMTPVIQELKMAARPTRLYSGVQLHQFDHSVSTCARSQWSLHTPPAGDVCVAGNCPDDTTLSTQPLPPSTYGDMDSDVPKSQGSRWESPRETPLRETPSAISST